MMAESEQENALLTAEIHYFWLYYYHMIVWKTEAFR